MTPNEAKWLSMLSVGIGSFAIGTLPACYAARGRVVSRNLFLSVLLCFGGGVLFATSVLHMLPETREQLPAYAELVFCCGFLLVYLIDEIVHHFCIGEHAVSSPERADATRCNFSSQNIDRTSHCTSSSNCLSHDAQNRRGRYQEYCQRQDTYEIGFNVPGKNIASPSVHRGRDRGFYCETARRVSQSNLSNNPASSARLAQYGTLSPIAAESSCPTENDTFLCHGNPAKSCTNTNITGHLGLCLALTIHAILEGLAIGLQRRSSEVLLLTISVVAHKFVVAFCLGLELISSGSKLLKNIAIVSLFSLGSVLGIGIGMLARKVEDGWASTLMPILQGLAGGTLLYVTVSEVLPRERARSHNNVNSFAGLIQFLAVLVGFSITYLTNSYLGENK